MTSSHTTTPEAQDNPAGQPDRPTPSRLTKALAWVGVVAGGLFIVGAIFFSGFFLHWGLDGQAHQHAAAGQMDCCADMKDMKDMKPGEMMPGGSMGPAPHSAGPAAPRP